MTHPTYRAALPQLADALFLTDSGIETDLIFNGGWDLPEFAAFVLLDDPAGYAALRDYFLRHVVVADSFERGADTRGADVASQPSLGHPAGLLGCATSRGQ